LPGLLYRWLTEPDGGSGIRILDGDGRWIYTPYDELAGMVTATAERCLDAHGEGATIAICAEHPRAFAAGFLGALAAGARVCCPPAAGVFGSRRKYDLLVSERLRRLRPDAVLCDAAVQDRLVGAIPAGIPCSALPERPGGSLPGWAVAEQGAVVQFTSGSSSAGRGVVVRTPALEANIAAITRWLSLGPGDGTSSWLPFHHDMGLVGCLLTPIAGQRPLWLMSPQQFVRRPDVWLKTFENGATTTAAPPFGYEHCSSRTTLDLDLDLSRWRVAIVGAERVRPRTLQTFTERFERHGFTHGVFRPGYGLAEATLAVTGRNQDDPIRAVDVDGDSLREGNDVRPATAETPRSARVTVLGCGRPLSGCTVEIRGQDGEELAAGQLGEIVVRSTALGEYEADVAGASEQGTRFRDDRLWTGDLGFLDDGELFCLGRIGDAIKVRGAFLSAETIENSVADELGLPSGAVVALLGTYGEGPHLVLLTDRGARERIAEVGRAGRLAAGGAEIEVVVCDLPPRLIERTSSGKPRRRAMWSAFTAGDFEEYQIVEDTTSPR
jgi:acyl-CoA synthetase (AMP-forming)/AMP-acid ligase II